MKPHIYVTRKLPNPGLEKLSQYFEITMNSDDRVLRFDEIKEHVRDKDALLCLLTDTIDKTIIQAGNRLKVISNYAVGFNNIDIEEATRRKIPVCITPGILTNATADLTWGLILAVTRRLVEGDKFTREGLFKGWAPELFLGMELHNKTLGILGMGRIGQAVAKRAKGFEMNVIYHSRTPKNDFSDAKFVSLEELLKTSDIVSLHTPLTPETHHLIGQAELNKMKKTAYLINTTRGPVVDEKALVQALKNKSLAGAGLDVYEQEPLLTVGLVELDNVVLLPHLGSATIETRTQMAILAAENAIAILKGERPKGIANPEVLRQ